MKISRLVLLFTSLLAGPAACGASAPGPEDANRPKVEERLEPHLERAQITRDFQPQWTPGSTRECLGRLVFEVAGPIEWALDPLNKVENNEPALFPDGVPGDQRERFGYGRMRIMVSQPVTAATMEMHRDRYRTAEGGGGVAAWTKAVERDRAKLEEAKKSGADEVFVRRYTRVLEESRESLRIAHNRRLHDFGLPDELSTESGIGSLRVRSLMGNHVIIFVTSLNAQKDDPGGRDRALAQIRADLKRVRVRAPGEIPNEPGVCLPGYFIADDGTGDYQAHASFRYVDRPNITYSIDTGYLPGPEASGGIAHPPTSNWIRVLSYPAILTTIPPENVIRRDVIKLRGFPAGGLSFDHTGMAYTYKSEEGGPNLQSYQLYAGMPGIEGVQVMPYVAITLRSWAPAAYPQLKQQPPPLAESEKRFDALLHNLHLRHTMPEMSDYERLLGKPTATIHSPD